MIGLSRRTVDQGEGAGPDLRVMFAPLVLARSGHLAVEGRSVWRIAVFLPAVPSLLGGEEADLGVSIGARGSFRLLVQLIRARPYVVRENTGYRAEAASP